MIVKWATLLAPLLVLGVATGCGSSPPAAKAGSVAAACREYLAWDNNPSATTLANDSSERKKIERLAAGSEAGAKFEKDFEAWATNNSPGDSIFIQANQVGADCRQAGVKTGLADAVATAPNDPSTTQATSAGPAASSTAGQSCTQQVRKWLASSDSSRANWSYQKDISSILSSGKLYAVMVSESISDETYLQYFLDRIQQDVGQLNASGTPEMPACADPGALWAKFVSDSASVGNDTAGTTEALADILTATYDFKSLQAELAETAPNSGMQGSS